MTSSSEEDDRLRSPDQPPTHSHLRRWSSPGECGGAGSLLDFSDESLATNSDYNNGNGNGHPGVSRGNLEGFFMRTPERRYSFYLGPELSPWGPFAEPRVTGSRSATAAAERRRERTATKKEDFPPFMRTLYSNGRPRFRLRRVRSEGRLEIDKVAVRGVELVKARGREGLRIGTVRILSREEQEQEEPDDEVKH